MELLGPILLPLVDLQPTLGDVDGVHGRAGGSTDDGKLDVGLNRSWKSK